MLFKNLVKKAASKINDVVKEVKDQVSAIQNIRKALSDQESMNMDEVQITNIILDEAAKCSFKAPGFTFKVGTYDDLRNELPAMEQKTRENLLNKVGVLRRINKVEEICNQMATAACQDLVGKIMGLTKFEEEYNSDVIYVFPEQLKSLWWAIAKRGENIEEIIRQIVRHEFRHAEQILAIRKTYGSDAVKLAFERESNSSYGTGPMEKDAWEGQHLETYRPIEEFLADEVAFLIK